MCGIIGRLGENNSVPYVLSGLKKLEYRGYDSAGISYISNNGISSVKAVGKLNNLEQKIKELAPTGSTAIGHTRWATHGKPSETNAHPHQSADGRFSVVHNGIIENSSELKLKYPSAGKSCISETDTEIIAQLLQQFYSGDIITAISKTVSELKGSYALCILCRDFKDCIFCTADKSPLVAAVSGSGCFAASDASALYEYTDFAYSIENGEICKLSRSDISFFDKNGKAKEKSAFTIEAEAASHGKQGYETYMMLEIMQQPEAVRNSLYPLINKNTIAIDGLSIYEYFIKNQLSRIAFVACGSAYHAAKIGALTVSSLCKVHCTAEIASEFRYAPYPANENTLAVFISQSGETADTLAALRTAKSCGAKTLSIVNVKGSAVAKESDCVIYTHAGRETAVATTKAFSAQLTVLYALGLKIALLKNAISETNCGEYINELRMLPEKIRLTLQNSEDFSQKTANELYTHNSMFFIGRQQDYPIALEGSLKMKEISYIHSEAYPAGELKHGTISLIEKDTPVIVAATDTFISEKTLSNLRETAARGAKIYTITSKELAPLFYKDGNTLAVENTKQLFLPSLTVLPLQLIAYYTALLRGCDIDMPKNLAKSVTVE